MKVFAMNDCDWMAAETLEEATAAYVKDFTGGREEHDVLDNPTELTDVEAEPPVKRTFREQRGRDGQADLQLSKLIAEGQKFPCFFASTEY